MSRPPVNSRRRLACARPQNIFAGGCQSTYLVIVSVHGRERKGLDGRSELAERLRWELGEDRVSAEPSERRLYSHDQAPLPELVRLFYQTFPDVVVRPGGVREVSRLLRLAEELRFPVIPRGAGTWGLGGAVPVRGGVVLDLTGMDRVLAIDDAARTVEVEAGATWSKALRAAESKGLWLGLHPSSYPAATVGGWLAVDGVGIGNFRFGRIARNVASVEAVLAGGRAVRVGMDEPLPVPRNDRRPRPVASSRMKDVLGRELIGSEGTLGALVGVVLKASPLPESIEPVGFEFQDLRSARPFLEAVAGDGTAVWHLMLTDPGHHELLRRSGTETGVRGALATAVLAGERREVLSAGASLEALAVGKGGKRAPEGAARRDWEQRSREFNLRKGGVGSGVGEVLVPLESYERVLSGIYRLAGKLNLEVAVLGTLVDRRTAMLMPYFLVDEADALDVMTGLSYAHRLVKLAFRNGGTPVGLGLHNAFNLGRMRSRKRISRLWAVKRMLDPKGVLNPGKRLLTGNRYGTSTPPWATRAFLEVLSMMRTRRKAAGLPPARGGGG